ncbi:hypothetical protein BC830DRAFT_1158992 [Chytriomyces sp. MP71]|nr:hypothetical protein BC830DRAFT_1158992 [Chytriomyces sp. MP71]
MDEIGVLDALLLQEEARFNRTAAGILRLRNTLESTVDSQPARDQPDKGAPHIPSSPQPPVLARRNPPIHAASLPLPAHSHSEREEMVPLASLGLELQNAPIPAVPALAVSSLEGSARSTSRATDPEEGVSSGVDRTVETRNWDIFVSYSWKNSREAFEKGQIQSDNACGSCDPRVLARRLTEIGHVSWLDTDRLDGGEPLYETLVHAITPAKFIVVCVSDEYALSKNCNLEWNFLHDRNTPYVIVFVGTHRYRDWDNSVIKFMAGNSLYIEAFGPASQSLAEDIFAKILHAVQKGLRHSAETQGSVVVREGTRRVRGHNATLTHIQSIVHNDILTGSQDHDRSSASNDGSNQNAENSTN